jgi:hypothetical protein
MNSNTQNTGEYSVVGIFDDYSHAQSAIRDLNEAGVPAHRIGIAIGQTGVDSQPDGIQHERSRASSKAKTTPPNMQTTTSVKPLAVVQSALL